MANLRVESLCKRFFPKSEDLAILLCLLGRRASPWHDLAVC